MNTSEHTPQHASHTPEERPTSTVQKRSYTEHRILRGASAIYARHYAGTGPAFVLMHGFPDNLHIYDRLIPYLRDRQVVTFDFLGWGASDKPTDYPYTSKQQEGELHAVLDALQIDQVVPVAHDASGPVAINWALDHPQRVSSLVLLNTYYGQAPTLRFPEFISLFADPTYAALTRAMAQDPTVAQWLLTWQGRQFGGDEQVQESLLPMIGPQFAGTPSTFPPFIGLTSDLHATLQACAGYLGHLFSKSVLERQGIVVVVRQALFKRMSLVASTPSCRQIGASDTCGNMRDEQAGPLSFRADSAHLFTFCAHSVLISTQRRAAWLVSYTLAESPSTKT